MCFGMMSTSVHAEEVLGTDELSAGAGVYLEVVGSADVSLDGETETEYALFMANVNDSMNVREEANEDSKAVGKLFKNCGGEILEQSNGWTKIRSGNLEGWAKDEYLLYGEEAQALANDIGMEIATVNASALRVRKEANVTSGIYGTADSGEVFEVIEKIDDEWYMVDYKGKDAYVSAQYVEVELLIDKGETNEQIAERKRKEEEEKAKLTYNAGAFAATADETKLLAALIHCEAGGEAYEGQLAVGAVVMNRVRSTAFPNSIAEVIYASGQFTPAMTGRLEEVYNGSGCDSCYKAAEEALAGNTNVGDAKYFRRAGKRQGTVIGNHVFWEN
jgi:spore germination cell wall hydrolase CwlJ-like protein